MASPQVQRKYNNVVQGQVVQGHVVDSGSDNEWGQYAGMELQDIQEVAVRNGFVRKVFSILAAQLVVTTVIAGAISQAAVGMKATNPAALSIMQMASVAASIGVMCVFMCCPQVMRQYPENYLLLAVFTVAESVMVGVFCAHYTVQSVLVAFGLTAFITTALLIFACTTKHDFTGLMPYFFIATLCLLGLAFCLSMASMFGASQTGGFRTVYMIYAGLGALLFSGYIVLDTQMILGGKHSSYRFTTDDYCMAAITIYLDIINLFIYILSLFGDRRI